MHRSALAERRGAPGGPDRFRLCRFTGIERRCCADSRLQLAVTSLARLTTLMQARLRSTLLHATVPSSVDATP